jgi:hypothetical protein
VKICKKRNLRKACTKLLEKETKREIKPCGFSSEEEGEIFCLMRPKTPCYVGPLSQRRGASPGGGRRDCLQIWEVAANTVNKQSRTVDNGWP